jgi:universal stress protein family protein
VSPPRSGPVTLKRVGPRCSVGRRSLRPRRTFCVASVQLLRQRLDVGLIVVGTHGRRGLLRALMESVAEKVVRLSPVRCSRSTSRARNRRRAKKLRTLERKKRAFGPATVQLMLSDISKSMDFANGIRTRIRLFTILLVVGSLVSACESAPGGCENAAGTAGSCYCPPGESCSHRCTSEPSCALMCSNRNDQCSVDCADNCQANCQSARDCSVVCGRDCIVACQGVTDRCTAEVGEMADVRCEMAHLCDIKCAGSCRVDCSNGAACKVECADPTTCNVDCTSKGTQPPAVLCPDGRTKVCGVPCG